MHVLGGSVVPSGTIKIHVEPKFDWYLPLFRDATGVIPGARMGRLARELADTIDQTGRDPGPISTFFTILCNDCDEETTECDS